MSSPVTQLAAILRRAHRAGDFCTYGTVDLLPPALSVDGVGPIAFPLLPAQAAQLAATAEQAPYGRGADTIVDTAIRNSWQIGPERVRIGGRHWPRTLATIVDRAAEGLGVGEPVEAELYKLLLYEPGSFFVSHRDTEKAPGMFATLVVVLPSACTGGALVVRHKDRSIACDLHSDDPAEASFAAFYADCLHEVLPVTAGFRLTLVYNLVRRGKGRAPQAPDYAAEQLEVAATLQAWRGRIGANDDGSRVPEKVVYPLEHAYTAPELGFSVLKGADAAAAGVLSAACQQAGCALHLALVTMEETGTAEYNANYGRGRRRWSDESADDQEFEAGEVDDWNIGLSDWCAEDGNPVSWGEIPVRDDELSPPNPFRDLKPDELHFQEASGNAGVSFERRYQRAALVVWPNDRQLAVLTQAGLGVTLPYLHDLAQRWTAEGADKQAPAWQQAHELAGHMIDAWPEHSRPQSGDTDSQTTGMLGALTRLGDIERIGAFLTTGPNAGRGYAKADNPAIIAALRLFQPAHAAALIGALVAGNAAIRYGACANLLAAYLADPPLVPPTSLRQAAKALLTALPRGARTSPFDWTGRGDTINASFVADLLVALGAIDPALADHAVTHILQNPGKFELDAVLVPAASDKLGVPAVAAQPAAARLRAACLAHLRARMALPLEPPADWRRPATLGCRCVHCSALSRFLADPAEKIWVFRAAAPDRNHVEDTIRKAMPDISTETEQRGRPYSLICTKNQASYERRVAERTQDILSEATLSGADRTP